MARRSKARRFLIGLAVIPAATAIGLEVGSRVLDRLRGKPWFVEERRAAIAEVCRLLSHRAFVPGEKKDEASATMPQEASILQPYVGWEHPSTQELIAQDVEYFRRPGSKRAFDVYVLGGSVAQMFGQLGVPKLVELLGRDERLAGRPIRIHDYACAGYKQPQQATNLAYLLALGHEPDAVIEMDGFNEAALGWSNAKNGTNPLYPSMTHWAAATSGTRADPTMVEHLHLVRVSQDRAREFGESFLASGLWRSCFLEHAGSLRLESLRRRYVQAYRTLTEYLAQRPKEVETSGPAYPEDDAGLERTIVRSWRENSISLYGMCAQRGIPYLHVLQPTLYDEGSKPLTEKEKSVAQADPTWIEGVRRIYPLLRADSARIAERGIAWCDASGVFADHPEDVYYDICHFREHGNEILAVTVADALLRSMREPGASR